MGPAGHDAIHLGDWSLALTGPGAFASPQELARAPLSWSPAPVPGTVAEALQAAGQWTFDRPQDFDASDCWYRCTFDHIPEADCREWLHVGGLATIAEVWLNGTLILTSDNMFLTHDVDVTDVLGEWNELVIAFRSLDAALAKRRARPRWKTTLVSHQQLRWFRTTLLGRIPGWSPPVAPVGPWRSIVLERRRPGMVADVDVRSFLEEKTGIVEWSCRLSEPGRRTVAADLLVGQVSTPLQLGRDETGCVLSGRAVLPNVAQWWPHTHGHPSLHSCQARVVIDGHVRLYDCGAIGFRRVEARQAGDGFAIAVNGTPIFCRGACWTVNDIVTLRAPASDGARDLNLLREAGANMIRVGGTMLYEDDGFYTRCDEAGVLVWQDFMFANMDYPADDASFRHSVEVEATQQLRRLRRHPSIAVYCGNSEVEQQAAMLGMPQRAWRGDLFARVLPNLCREWHPDVPYVPSSPSGGDLPFHVGAGVAHYYGVGAYLRPMADVRRANVRFAAECLGFANVPEPATIELITGGARPATHDPRWKQRTPRDTGASWDFEDVRDHYLREIFSEDAVRLRTTDPARYLEFSRVTTGEIMSRVFAEWRRAGSTCGGALVWFLKDLWPGAGWGILDSGGIPKSCFYYLRRTWQPQAVLLTDEGLDGLHVHVINDGNRVLAGTLDLALLRRGHVVVAAATAACAVGPHSVHTFRSDALLDGFHDVSYAYRFGPPAHDVVAATLYGEAHETLNQTFWIRDAAAVAREHAGAVVAEVCARSGSDYTLTVSSERFLFAARIDARGFLASDNYFCLMPGATKVINLHALPDAPDAFDGYLEALNLDGPIRIERKAPARRVVS